MNPLKLKLIEELIENMASRQGKNLKKSFDDEMAPKELPVEMDDAEKPEGLSVEKVSVMKDPAEDPMHKDPLSDESSMDMGEQSESSEPEMSDDELKELLAQYLK